MPPIFNYFAALFLFIAILHTFLAPFFNRLAERFEKQTLLNGFFHLLGEVEIVFGLWAGVFIFSSMFVVGARSAIQYVESLNFTEAIFVFAVMVVAATRPIMSGARNLIWSLAKVFPVSRAVSIYISILLFGPLMGSFITEPAAMTVTALLLRETFYRHSLSNRFRYLTLGVLFVNVSIGGVLTHFSAPPVLMVARVWEWGTPEVFSLFGWKAFVAVVVNAVGAGYVLRSELTTLPEAVFAQNSESDSPLWLVTLHTVFLSLIVLLSHHPVVFIGLLLFFMGTYSVTRGFQSELKLRESLLVAFFLSGLVVLGGPQKWWLDPLLRALNPSSLFAASALLTAFTDNAALTYLGAQIAGILPAQKYALVAGAVGAGGLTVIANAPNPAGYAILGDEFGEGGISAWWLFVYALIPTLMALTAFWVLP